MVFFIGLTVGAMAGVIGAIVTALFLSKIDKQEEEDEQNM